MRGVVLVLALLSSISLSAQIKGQTAKGVPVKVTNWDGIGLIVFDNFFDETKDSIIAQIGEEEFSKVKAFCGAVKWPVAMQQKFGRLSKEERIAFYSRFDKLKKYRIASYQHYYEGEKKDRFCILRIPYAENKDWDSTAKWDTVYFVVLEKMVEEIVN